MGGGMEMEVLDGGEKARQLHPDPAIRPSVKRAETIEKDKRDI